MDITVYLPDELGQWAKETGLNLSATLRGGVEAERRRRSAMAATLEDSEAHELPVTDQDGRSYTVRLHGAIIADPGDGTDGLLVFLGKDERVYVFDGRRDQALHEDVDPDELRDWLDQDALYLDAMAALGREAVIDIGLPQ
jgi:hypothetical protein